MFTAPTLQPPTTIESRASMASSSIVLFFAGVDKINEGHVSSSDDANAVDVVTCEEHDALDG